MVGPHWDAIRAGQRAAHDRAERERIKRWSLGIRDLLLVVLVVGTVVAWWAAFRVLLG